MEAKAENVIPIPESHRKALEILAEQEGRDVAELLQEAIRAYVARPEKLALVAPAWSADWSRNDARSWWPSEDVCVRGLPRDLHERCTVVRSGSLAACLRTLKDRGVGHVMFPDGEETDFYVLSVEHAIQMYDEDPTWVAAGDAIYGLDDENRTWIVSSSAPERNPEEPLWVAATRSTLAGVTHKHWRSDSSSEPCPGCDEDRRTHAQQLRNLEIECAALRCALFIKNVSAREVVEKAAEHLGKRARRDVALGPVDGAEMKEIASSIAAAVRHPRIRSALRRVFASNKVEARLNEYAVVALKPWLSAVRGIPESVVAERILELGGLRPDPSSQRDLDDAEPDDEDHGPNSSRACRA